MSALMYLKLGLVAVPVAVAGYFAWESNHLKVELVQAKGTIETLTEKLEIQNGAVVVLKQLSDAKTEAGKAAMVEAKKATAVKTTDAAAIYTALPSVPSQDCASALALGNTP